MLERQEAQEGRKHHARKHKKAKGKHRSQAARTLRSVRHDRPQPPGRAEQRRPEDDPGLRRGRQPGDHGAAERRQGVRRPARRPVLRGPRRDVRRDQLPRVTPATREAARTTSPATACTRSSCRCPRRTSPRTASEVASAKDKNAVVGVWASTERKRVQVARPRATTTTTATTGCQVSRLGNPLVNEVVIPLGQEGPVQPHDSGQRRRAVRRVRGEPGARDGHERAVQPRASRRRTGTDIVLALLQGVPGLNQQTGKPVDTIKINLGTAADGQPEPPRRARRRHRRATRTAAV